MLPTWFGMKVAVETSLSERYSMAADIITKEFYPDLYTWLQAECNIRAWLGVPLPEPDDPRIALFAERNTIATGEIETTNHVCWVAGVKR